MFSYKINKVLKYNEIQNFLTLFAAILDRVFQKKICESCDFVICLPFNLTCHNMWVPI